MGLDNVHFTEVFRKEGGFLIPHIRLLQALEEGDVILNSLNTDPRYTLELQLTLNESVAIENPRLPGIIIIQGTNKS